MAGTFEEWLQEIDDISGSSELDDILAGVDGPRDCEFEFEDDLSSEERFEDGADLTVSTAGDPRTAHFEAVRVL